MTKIDLATFAAGGDQGFMIDERLLDAHVAEKLFKLLGMKSPTNHQNG